MKPDSLRLKVTVKIVTCYCSVWGVIKCLGHSSINLLLSTTSDLFSCGHFGNFSRIFMSTPRSNSYNLSFYLINHHYF